MADDLEPLADGDGAAARRLGERLKKLREYLGMSQQHVAERTGIPRSAVSDIERGLRQGGCRGADEVRAAVPGSGELAAG